MMTGDRAKLYDTKATSGVVVADELQAAWAVVKASEGAEWVLGTYDPAVKGRVNLSATGSGGFAELCTHVADDSIVYGACAVWSGAIRRLFFLTWVGPGVSAIKKGKVSLEKQGVYNTFEGVVGEAFVTDRGELTEAAVAAKLAKSIPSVRFTP